MALLGPGDFKSEVSGKVWWYLWATRTKDK